MFQDGVKNACIVLISCQLTQSCAPIAKTCSSFIKMSSSVELQPAPPSFKSKVWKDFGFKVLYDAQGVRNVVKEIVICGHCFLELRYVSWHLYRDMYRILRKCIVAALFISSLQASGLTCTASSWQVCGAYSFTDHAGHRVGFSCPSCLPSCWQTTSSLGSHSFMVAPQMVL